jgi:uncharacterized protein
MSDASTLIGHVLDVNEGQLVCELVDTEDGTCPIVTVGDEDVHVGRLGSYVSVEQAELRVIAMVTRMRERERLPATGALDEDAEATEPICERMLALTPVGCVTSAGEFERGVSVYPTTGAEVHALCNEDTRKLFKRFVDKGYEVGTLAANPSLSVYLDPSSLFGRHCAVLGQTGSGKSWTVASLLQKAVALMPRAHVVLLDLHGEYRDAFKKGDARVVDATQLEMPYWLMGYSELCDLLIDRSEISAHNQTAYFRDTLNDLRQQEGARLELPRTTVDTPVFFSMDELLTRIREQNTLMVEGQRGPKQGPLFGQFDRFLMRLDSRMNDVRYDFLLKPKTRTNSESLEALLRDFCGLGSPRVPITVIDLSPVPSDVRPVVTAQIGRLAFEFNFWNQAYREFPILLVCEEAHSYIGRQTDSQLLGARRSMERVAKEGRKYGVGMMVVSQRPSEVSDTVLSQVGTFICLRMTNPDDQSHVRQLVPEAERNLMNILAGMRRGEALVLGEATPLPSRLLVDPPNPTPRSHDVDFFGQWTDGPEDIDVGDIVDRWRRQDREQDKTITLETL